MFALPINFTAFGGMGKYSELYRKRTDLVRSGEVDGRDP